MATLPAGLLEALADKRAWVENDKTTADGCGLPAKLGPWQFSRRRGHPHGMHMAPNLVELLWRAHAHATYTPQCPTATPTLPSRFALFLSVVSSFILSWGIRRSISLRSRIPLN